MPRCKIFLACLFNLTFTIGAFCAEKYVIDPTHSAINFVVPHLMVSKVTGKVSFFKGSLLYDESNPRSSSVEVIMKTASIDTGDLERDNHLRSPEFFDAQQYPEITFKSTQIDENDNLTLCRGILVMHGESKEIDIPFRVLGKIKDPSGNERIAIEGTAVVNRRDFGITWNKLLDGGGVLVGNEVRVNLSLEAIKN
jgi:polyisoprenoid-binding protein YceI